MRQGVVTGLGLSVVELLCTGTKVLAAINILYLTTCDITHDFCVAAASCQGHHFDDVSQVNAIFFMGVLWILKVMMELGHWER